MPGAAKLLPVPAIAVEAVTETLVVAVCERETVNVRLVADAVLSVTWAGAIVKVGVACAPFTVRTADV